MSIREQNIQAIVDYFESGIKPADTPLRLGVELEHTIVTEDGLKPVSYSEEHGVQWTLWQLSEDFPRLTKDAEGDLLGVSRSWQYVTIEPAAQLELSAGPYEQIGEIRIEFEQFQRNLAKILSPVGHKALTVGYHPTAAVDTLELIPKNRYRQMDAHFTRTGTMGRCMMRGSGSAQISIDYTSVEDCLHKLRLANGLAPIIALICDNSPVFEGAPRTQRMVRTTIWQNTDPARCGIVPGVMELDFSLERYAAYVLDTPAIFTILPDGSYESTDKTFGELYESTPMDRDAVEHALSLMFNDVRLKYYIENRTADAMPIPFVTAYAALVKGLFYTEAGVEALDEMLDGVGNADVEAARDALIRDGYEATVYGRPVADAAADLFEVAHNALATNERNYLSPLHQLVRTRKTLADLASS